MSEIIVTGSIGKDHYKVTLQTSVHTIIADEPNDKGGGDEGMNPFEILAASLGACTCATVRMYADRKEMHLDGMTVVISLARDEEKNVTNLHRDITLYGELKQDDRERLLQIANKCPVHKILTNPINIETVLLT